MFKNKKINLVISIVVAVCIWAYVVGEINPSISMNFSSVKVEFKGASNLVKQGMALVDPGKQYINISAVGNRATIKKAEKKDFTATVDVSNCGIGENKIAIEIKCPKNVKLESTSRETITVEVEKIVTERKNVKTSIKGLGEDKEAGDITTNPEVINVTGAESQVNKVEYIKAEVNANKTNGNKIEQTVTATPVDSKGKKVEFVKAEDKKILVSASINTKKTVNLKTEVTGTVDSSVQLSKVDVQDHVTLQGDADKLKEIDSVTANPINIDGIKSNTEVPVSVDLPEGVKVSKNENLVAKVTVKQLTSKTLQFVSGDVKTSNLGANMKVKVKETNISGQALGTEDGISKLSAEDVVLTINLSGYKAGNHKIKIKSELPKEIKTLTLNPSYVEVEIREGTE